MKYQINEYPYFKVKQEYIYHKDSSNIDSVPFNRNRGYVKCEYQTESLFSKILSFFKW